MQHSGPGLETCSVLLAQLAQPGEYLALQRVALLPEVFEGRANEDAESSSGRWLRILSDQAIITPLSARCGLRLCLNVASWKTVLKD